VAVVTQALTDGQRVFRGADAAIEVLRIVGYGRLARLLAIVPRWLRDAGYGAVAATRYRLFGRYAVCPVPPPEVRSRFVGF